MKKNVIFSIILMLCFGFNANAEKGINAGVTVLYGAFEVDGASEKFASGPGAAATQTTNGADEAEGAFGLASIFVEKTVNEKFSIGLDYVPMSAESETSTNTVDNSLANKVQVDFEDLTTLYGVINLNENIYAKAGLMRVDVITNENLATGGAYPNTELDGVMVGLGYNRDLDQGMFVRVEGTYMDFDGASVTSTTDSTKSISVDGIEGYGAKLSIGKSF